MLFEVLSAAAVAFTVSFAACAAQLRSGPVDIPDVARKAHSSPTPTGGGIGVGIGFAAAIIALSVLSHVVSDEMTTVGAGYFTVAAVFAYAFMMIGFADDARPIGPRLKFALFAVIALAACYVLGPVREFRFGFGVVEYLPLWAGLIGSAMWLFTMVNCVNFMDGANGLAMGAMAIGLSWLGVIGFIDGSPATVSLTFIGAAALLGFLCWNFPSGRLFAGDSGALFAGALGALAALIAIHRTGMSPFAAGIIFFPLLGDALLTLAWRAGRRRSLLDGHSEHVYQILTRDNWSHARVAVTYWVAMAACGALALAVTRMQDSPAPWIALLALCVAGMIVSARVRKYALARGIAEI
ncbi:MAG: hypothetical protein AB7O98_01240 [Hyphomonadaceae bacterium]